jgi:hypothetical protein
MDKPTEEELKSVVQIGKPTRKKPRYLFNPCIEACLQNVDNNLYWRKGDPNTETNPDFDLIWVVWILRQIFPKDVVTHFVNLNGGFSFTVHRSLPLPEEMMGIPHLQLHFWKERDLYATPTRIIYFNIAAHNIVKKKGATYLHHHDKRIAWLENKDY